jgi:hypothetical protein
MRPPGTLSLLWFWRGTVLRVVTTMVVVGFAMFAVSTAMEVPMAPWMRSFGLWPTLTGTWHGMLETPSGRRSLMYFDIQGEVFSAGRRYIRGNNIRGSARWCDGSGQIRDYEISGDVDNWRGTRFHLSTRSVVDREDGEWPTAIQGDWSGDEIRTTGVLVSHSRTATATATRSSRSPGPPPIRITLRRGSEADFLAACGRLNTQRTVQTKG